MKIVIANNAPVITLLVLTMLLTTIANFSIISEKNANPKLKWLMFAIFFGIINYYLVHVLVITGLIVKFPFLLRGMAPFYYIVQPAIYFYVAVNLNENYKFSKIHLLHLMPAIYSIIDNYGFYINGYDHWQYWANKVSSNYANITNYQGSLFKARINFVLRIILYVAYTIFAWRLYFKNLQLNKEIKNMYVLKWLKFFLIFITIFVISITFSTIYGAIFISTINEQTRLLFEIPLYATGISVILIATYISLNPILLYGLPKINYKSINENNNTKSNTNNKSNDDVDTNNSEFQLANSIISEIKDKQLYSNAEFSVKMASEYFSIPNHHISYLLNNHIKKSFPDIVCELRIDHAIQLLKDNNSKKYTMEAIGNISGFNSRTTFYVSFKKITGITPNEYLNTLKTNGLTVSTL